MRWRQGRRSKNVRDIRGRRAPRRGRPVAIGGGTLLLLAAAVFLFGANPGEILRMLSETSPPIGAEVGPGGIPPRSGPVGETEDFIAVVLADTEDTWGALFARHGKRYQPPVLNIFDRVAPSACGTNSSAVGPFYCPADRMVYLDLSFFRDLRDRFAAPGDFAQAYVIAHEVGHHVQNLLGISDRVHRLRSRVSQREGNALSVRMELQADCFAGVWGHHAATERNLLEDGDVEEGLRAAAAIGDDRIQMQSRGHVSPEAWTHGSSEQRVEWFRRGLRTGRLEDCETFEGNL